MRQYAGHPVCRCALCASIAGAARFTMVEVHLYPLGTRVRERTGFVLFDPATDQIARDVVPPQALQRFATQELLGLPDV
jgi:hypothetical protein